MRGKFTNSNFTELCLYMSSYSHMKVFTANCFCMMLSLDQLGQLHYVSSVGIILISGLLYDIIWFCLDFTQGKILVVVAL